VLLDVVVVCGPIPESLGVAAGGFGVMWKLLDVEMLVCAPSEIEFRDGMFHCIERYSDEFFIRKVYSPAIFVAAIAVANEALAKWRLSMLDERVVSIRRK